MIKINLRDYYPFYQYDCFVEVREEVADVLMEFDRQETAYLRRMCRNNAHTHLTGRWNRA
jgi:RNA polymerase sigma-70 factor (ECF subfamily)